MHECNVGEIPRRGLIMCMALVFSDLRHGTIIAVDRRHSAYRKDGGTPLRGDYGGKLVRAGNGWIAMGGDALYGAMALPTLARTDLGNIVAVCGALSGVATDAKARAAARWPGAPFDPDAGRTRYFLATGPLAAIVKWNGELQAVDYGCLYVAYPHRWPDAEGTESLRNAAHGALLERLSRATSLWASVRIISREFAAVASTSDSVSPWIELGIADRYLIGNASEIAQMSDAAIRSALTDAPAPHYDAFTRILSEHIAA